MIPIVTALLSEGLELIGNAVLSKGKDWVEKETGVKLGDKLTPEQTITLRKFELEHEEKLRELQLEDNKLDLEAYKLEVTDRGVARDRETRINESANAAWLAKNTTSLLASAVMVLSFILFYMVIYTTIPADKKDIVIYILGVLSGAVTQVLSYYFGSSKSSQAKDDTLADAVRKVK